MFPFVSKPKVKGMTRNDSLHWSSISHPWGRVSLSKYIISVAIWVCQANLRNIPLFNLSANLSNFNSCHFQHKSHSSRAPAIPGSSWFIKHNMHFTLTCLCLECWLLLTHQTRSRAVPLWGFPGSRTPCPAPQHYFSSALLSLNCKSSPPGLQAASSLVGGPASH